MRVCVIGAGPSGMSVLYHFEKLKSKGVSVPEIVCYEKDTNWGGLWNYTWRTGIDEHGEPVHGSMYRYLWSNGPKEASLEFPDYTFMEHFKKPIPSYPPREVLFDYLQGRWNKFDLRKYIKFSHSVRSVHYHKDTNDFSVEIYDHEVKAQKPVERFDYVINAAGHFSVPYTPTFPGIEKFPGRVMHSHDFRDAREFSGKTVLIVGASYSAEDLSMQCIKYGAKHVVCTYRNKPMGFKWPKEIEERPLLTEIVDRTVHFKDGSKIDVDAIVLATGYLNHYPWFEDSLRMRAPNTMYPPSLYKGTLWLEGGNYKLLYVGIQDQYYTFTMFDAQAFWAIKYILGEVKLPSHDEMVKDTKKWIQRFDNLKDCYEDIDFQADFVNDLAKESNYGADLDIRHLFHEWEDNKHRDILTYRDHQSVSKYTGVKTPVHHTPWFEAMDDTMACFMATKN